MNRVIAFVGTRVGVCGFRAHVAACLARLWPTIRQSFLDQFSQVADGGRWRYDLVAMTASPVYLNFSRIPLRAEAVAGLPGRLRSLGVERAYVYLGALFPWRVGAFRTCADTYHEAVTNALFGETNVSPWLPVVFRSGLSPMRGVFHTFEGFPLRQEAVEQYGAAFVKLFADVLEDVEPFVSPERTVSLDSPLPRAGDLDEAAYRRMVLEPLLAEAARLDVVVRSQLPELIAAGANKEVCSESGAGTILAGTTDVARRGLSGELQDVLVLLNEDQRGCVSEFDEGLEKLWDEIRRIKEAEYLGRRPDREPRARRLVAEGLARCEKSAESLSDIASQEVIHGVATALVGAAEEAFVLTEHRRGRSYSKESPC